MRKFPLFIFLNKGTVSVNVNHITHIYDRKKGSAVELANGKTLLVTESLDQVNDEIYSEMREMLKHENCN